MKTKIRVRKARLPGSHYHGCWCAAHGKSFRPFAYSQSLDKLMNRISMMLKVRAQKAEEIEARRLARIEDRKLRRARAH